LNEPTTLATRRFIEMKMDAPFVIALCGLVAALIGAALVMVGTNIHVRDSLDHFMTDLHRQGVWLLWGAAFTVIASVLTLIAHIWPLLRK
jgi:Na+/H+-translocating membrane pyrophosphatase